MFGKSKSQPQSNEQAAPPTDLFDAIGDSDEGYDSVYVLAGVYPVVEVEAVKIVSSRKGDDIFIAELRILQSLVDERPEGTQMSWAANFRHDATAGNVKSFLAATMNVPAAEVDADGARFACSEENPCQGRLLRIEAANIVTKAGNDFTRCSFRALPDEIQEQRGAFREAVGLENVPF